MTFHPVIVDSSTEDKKRNKSDDRLVLSLGTSLITVVSISRKLVNQDCSTITPRRRNKVKPPQSKQLQYDEYSMIPRPPCNGSSSITCHQPHPFLSLFCSSCSSTPRTSFTTLRPPVPSPSPF
jgi:hypothetical protein